MAANTTIKRFRPKAFEDPDLDISMKTAYDQLYTLGDQAILGVTNNQALSSGTTKVTGAQNGVATGLATVARVIAAIQGASAVNEWVTAMPTPNVAGKIDLYCWKPTASGDNTPIASTTEREIAWFAIGTRVQ